MKKKNSIKKKLRFLKKLVAYLLNMIFFKLRILCQIFYIYVLYNFGKVLYQYLETGTQIELL